MAQGVVLHGGCLEASNALRLVLPFILRSLEECPTKPSFKHRHFIPRSNNQYTLMQWIRSPVTFKYENEEHICMHPACPTCRLYTTDTYKDDVSKWVSLITVIKSDHLPYLCTEGGYPQGFPSTQ